MIASFCGELASWRVSWQVSWRVFFGAGGWLVGKGR